MKSIHANAAKATLLAVVCLTFVLTLVASFARGTSAAQGGKVVEAVLYPDPQAYDGPCPAVIKFNGKITTDGPATVQYVFERSDGASGPVSTLVFDGAGTKEVSTTWTLGGAALPTYGGWEQIVISAPNKAGSNKAAFKLSCKAPQGAGPLTNAQPGAGLPRKGEQFPANSQTNVAQNSQKPSEPLPLLLKQRAVMPKQEAIKLIPDKNFAGIFIVKFVEGSHVRRRENRFVSDVQQINKEEIRRLQRSQLAAADVASQLDRVNEIVGLYGKKYGFTVAGMFEDRRRRQQSPEAQFQEKEKLEIDAGEELADLDLYYIIAAPDFKDIVAQEQFMNELNRLKIFEDVQAAFLTEGATTGSHGGGATSPAYALPPPPPDLSANQGYLNAAPAGIDARYAWTIPGGRGRDVRLIDVEYDWVTDHEDFAPRGNLFWGGRPACAYDGGGTEHGTAVMGVLNAPHNGFGVSGIAPDIRYGLSSVCRPLDWLFASTSHEAWFTLFSGESIAGRTHNIVTSYAIDDAALALNRGDVLLVEQHTFGPSSGLSCSCNCDQWEFVAMEYYQHSFDVIRRAAARGIVVVEAAGNGGQNLDAPHYNRRFDPSFRYSAALLVGASNGSGDNNRACFSNFGRRVDVHGWGGGVATLGYGMDSRGARTAPWFTGEIPRQYTAVFNGTSSASPIVAGAVASIQGARRAAGLDPLYPAQLRMLFISTGTPQGTASASENIGRLPDLRAALTSTLRPIPSRGGYAGAGIYSIQARHSRKVLDINIDWFSGQDNGRPLGQFDNINWDNQKFAVESLPGGFVRFVALHSRKCLDVPASSRDAGAGLQQWECNGGDNQQFTIEPVGDFYRIRAKHSGLYLDVAGSSLSNGARVVQWFRNDADNQLFQFTPTR
ncbi:MAG: RICIN domain-containing protein [Pyrinomonadaceae bacterium]